MVKLPLTPAPVVNEGEVPENSKSVGDILAYIVKAEGLESDSDCVLTPLMELGLILTLPAVVELNSSLSLISTLNFEDAS